MRARVIAVALVAALLSVVFVAGPAEASSKVSALTLLSKLTVKAESNSGYARSKFQLWIDANHDGQNTRAEVLISESKTKVKFTTSSHRTVKSGKWVSAYDHKVITTASKLDIDHMVPLAEAWGSGAKKWNAATRKAYANDLSYGASLIAVSASANRSKGDRDPAQWLPTYKPYRCTYVRNWVAVKYRWHLSVDKAEKAALTKDLKACSSSARLVTKPALAKIVKASTSTTSNPPSSGGLDPQFGTCTEAKAAGYGPYVEGRDPEYAWYDDRDHDGIVCE